MSETATYKIKSTAHHYVCDALPSKVRILKILVF